MKRRAATIGAFVLVHRGPGRRVAPAFDKAALATRGIHEPEPWYAKGFWKSVIAFTIIGAIGGALKGLANRKR